MKPYEFYDMNNDYAKQMFDIINNRLEPANMLFHIGGKDAPVKNKDTMSCKHHIIPRCYYRHNNLEIDNSLENIVFLTPGEHLKVHILMREYFKDISDMKLYYSMALAIDRMTNGDNDWLKLRTSSIEELNEYIEEYSKNVQIAAEATSFRYKNLSNEQRQKISQNISDGWDNIDDDTYAMLCKKHSIDKSAEWHDGKSNMGTDEWRRKQSIAQKEAWKNKSPEEQNAQKEKLRQIWKDKSPEEKQRLNDEQSKIQTDRWNKLSDEQKAAHGKHVSSRVQWIKEHEPEKWKAWQEKRAKAVREAYAKKREAKKKANS